jgi:saccharopine dehydrogenase-like NADP-dependent oxidoreductase
MHNVLIVGAGKIGSILARVLARQGHYHVYLIDRDDNIIARLQSLPHLKHLTVTHLDIDDSQKFRSYISEHDIKAMISCLPHYNTVIAARFAKECRLHYFDLTEDEEATETIIHLAQGADSAFISQCGVAPGFINIIANGMMQTFDSLENVKLRAGALPACTSHPLKYAITWSLDGVINEYANRCQSIINGEVSSLMPFHDYETLDLDGTRYEAFNTSGGIGRLIELYNHKVKNLDYKTIRYLGHCEKMRFLMDDLKLKDDRVTLKKILEAILPRTYQDVVILYVSVTGIKKGKLREEYYYKKIIPQKINEIDCTAIQVATIAGLGSVVDKVLSDSHKHPEKYRGFIHQTSFSKDELLAGQFGQYFSDSNIII